MKNMMTSIKEISNLILKIESRHQLFAYEIDGIYIWELLRWELFRAIARKLGLEGQAHTFLSHIPIHVKWSRFFISSLDLFFKNPLLGNRQRNTLIFDHPRKMSVDGKYIDIYTDFLLQDLKPDEYEVLERHYLGLHSSNKSDAGRKYLDVLNLYIILTKPILNKKIKLSVLDVQFLKTIELEIHQAFRIKIDLLQLAAAKLVDFKAKFAFYNHLLKKRRPKNIILVVSYSQQALIAAAKYNQVWVTEIQHGVISPYNLAYHYPNQEHISYFPDELWVFGDYWKTAARIPLQTKVVARGFPFLNKRYEKYRKMAKKKNTILFVSQGTIGSELSEWAFKMAKRLTEYQFIYKLHPGEYDRWQHIYPMLVEAKSLHNFELLHHPDTDLYAVMAQTEFQIGVSSMTLFEGLAFRCKTIILGLPGHEHVEYLVHNGIAKMAGNVDEAVRSVMNFEEIIEWNTSYFFGGNYSN